MINLMPDNAKKELRAARMNVVLLHYSAVLLLAGLFLALVLGGSYVILTQTKDSAQRLIETNDTKAEVYSQTKTQVEALSAKLADAKAVLDQEVLYSDELIKIGKLMPAGTVIEAIELNTLAFTGKEIELKVYAKSTENAVQLRENFQNSKIFSNVTFQSITGSNAGIEGYPVSASITVTIGGVRQS